MCFADVLHVLLISGLQSRWSVNNEYVTVKKEKLGEVTCQNHVTGLFSYHGVLSQSIGSTLRPVVYKLAVKCQPQCGVSQGSIKVLVKMALYTLEHLFFCNVDQNSAGQCQERHFSTNNFCCPAITLVLGGVSPGCRIISWAPFLKEKNLALAESAKYQAQLKRLLNRI